jgi:hypothetical protein
MAKPLLQLGMSILILLLLGFAVGPLIRFGTKGSLPRPPKPMSEALWNEIIGRGTGVSLLGYLERFFYLAAFWNEAPILIAGWLAFKVASGWHNWSMIVKLPENLEGVDQIEYLRARSQLGSWIFHRFLIGTLANILMALIAVVLGKGLYAIISRYLCRFA